MSNLQLKNVQHGFTVDVDDVATTVRLGDKWFNAYRDAFQQQGTLIVDLWQCPRPHAGPCVDSPMDVDDEKQRASWGGCFCEYRGTGEIVGAWRGNLIDVPRSLLLLEHEPESREWRGLFKSLQRGYGSQVSALSPVTVLIYQRLTTHR